MTANTAQRRHTNALLVVVLTGLFVASAAGGCDCQGGGINQVAPVIEVTPKAIAFDPTAVKAEATQLVTIKNTGNDTLTVSPDPKIVEGTEDQKTELALRQVLSPVDCATGAARTVKDPSNLLPGQCATVMVVYRPLNIGNDTGKLVIKSNDKQHAEVDVPITASGAAPKIKVCLLAGDCVSQKTCNQTGQHLTLPFPLTGIGATTTCAVSIDNVGQLPLKNLTWSFKSGNRYKDYVLDPADLKATGDLAPGQGIQTKIHFSPKAGGDHQALVEMTSSDPDQPVLDIDLDGKGDGPKLCPDPVPTEDYGQVTVGQTSTKNIKLTNCGTMALSVTKLQVQDATGQGASTQYTMGSSAPAAPIQLAAGQSTQVPVDFKPDSATTFNGRLYLESTDPVVPSGWVNLTGQGVVPPSCQLQVATQTLDFGTGAPGYPVTKTLAVSNPGKLDCTGVTATVTAGTGVTFSILGNPSPFVLHPGDIITLQLKYDPQDTTPPDTGTLELASPDAAGPLDVTLQGTPASAPSCTLNVTPRTGNFSFGNCFITSFTPRVAEFGTVRVSKTKVITASLENTGSIPCTVSSAKLVAAIPLSPPDPNYTLPDGANTVVVNGTKTNTINPGQVGQINVQYQPASEAQDCGSLMIQTNDTNSDGSECGGFSNTNPQPGCYQVFLQGQGVRSAIEVIPSEVKFGVITVGCASLERTVTIYNTGGASLNITKIYTDPPGAGQPASGPFTITSMPPLPAALPGGGSVQMKVKYRPPDAKTHNALLVIESDAQNAAIMTVPLSGQGTTDSHQTDHFTQLSQPMVDVLWMIDDSCSMGDKQQNVSDQSQTFFQRATQLNTDFHLAVVTTDMDNPNESGRFQSRNGAPKIITPSTPNPVQAFSDDALLGTNGLGTEKGLAAVHAALTDPLLSDPAANAGFLRQDAKLVVIAVSDEDDQSSATVDFYVDFLKNIKGFHNADLMSFSSIVGYDESTKKAASCTSTSTGGQAVPGPRYVEVTNRTNGIARSICSTDWGKIADDLGLNAFGAKSQFFLTREAVPSSIVVHVNGQQVSQPAWSYDAPSNSIIFDASSVPPQGATIDVDYDTVCH